MSTNISLTSELEQYVKNQVARGLYGSVSEFMRDAVRMHRQHNIEHNLYVNQLQGELAQAAQEIDRGKILPLYMEALVNNVLRDE